MKLKYRLIISLLTTNIVLANTQSHSTSRIQKFVHKVQSTTYARACKNYAKACKKMVKLKIAELKAEHRRFMNSPDEQCILVSIAVIVLISGMMVMALRRCE